ncbi:MAG: transcriptional repressor [Treponema sp.]|nr:transcriptional repressor [Treponema sp.]
MKAEYKTRQQELLTSYLKQMQGKHFTAEEICSHFESKDIRVSPATVYRYLEKMVREGDVLKIFIDEHSASCFEYVGDKGCKEKSGHFHLKCEECGTLIHLDSSELYDMQNFLAKKKGFKIDAPRTVFYGICEKCSSRREGKNEE